MPKGLIVAGALRSLAEDVPTRYRCFNLQEALKRLGIRTRVIGQKALEQLERQGQSLGSFDFLVAHRPIMSLELLSILDSMPSTRKIADYDDLVFDLEVLDELLVQGWGSSAHEATRLIASYREAMGLFDAFSASTDFLAERVLKNFPGSDVRVVPNHLDRHFLARASEVLRYREWSSLRLGYFGGSGHKTDLNLAEDALLEVLERDSRRTILVPENLDFVAGKLESQVMRYQAIPYREAWRFYSKVDVAIAPLASSLFNRAKSGIKFMEAVVHGVPIVASRNSDLQRFDTTMLHVEEDFDDWPTQIEFLLGLDSQIKESEAHSMNEALGPEFLERDDTVSFYLP
jgi:glycosyltransferase involved in cell wall biosynthesis